MKTPPDDRATWSVYWGPWEFMFAREFTHRLSVSICKNGQRQAKWPQIFMSALRTWVDNAPDDMPFDEYLTKLFGDPNEAVFEEESETK